MLVRNLQDMWQKLGGAWVPPSGAVEVSEKAYQRYKTYFDRAVQSGRIEIVYDDELEEVEETVYAEEESKEDANDVTNGSTDSIDTKNELQEISLVREYLDNGLHWKRVEKALSEIDSTDELKGLLDEALAADLADDHIVVRLVKARLEEVTAD